MEVDSQEVSHLFMEGGKTDNEKKHSSAIKTKKIYICKEKKNLETIYFLNYASKIANSRQTKIEIKVGKMK